MSSLSLIEKTYNNALAGCNCAESIIMAADEVYGFHINPDDVRLFSGYGAGCYQSSTCGALLACVAVLSRLIVKTKAHDCRPQLARAMNILFKKFEEKEKGQMCRDIRPLFWNPEEGCAVTIKQAAEVLEEVIGECKEKGIIES